MAIINNKKTINFGDKVWSTNEILNNTPWALVGVCAEGVVFEGNNGGVDTYSNLSKTDFNANNDYSQAITVGLSGKRGELTIKGGVYMSPATCIYVVNGVCTIEGGFFFGQPDSSQSAKSDAEREYYDGCNYRNFTLNLLDSARKNGTASLVVKGGKFAGFDPAHCWSEGEGTNFVAEGYESIKLEETFTYTVKDANRADCGQLITVPVWEVRPVNA